MPKKNVLIIYSDLGDGGIQRLLSLTSDFLSKKYNLYLALFKDEQFFPFSGNIIPMNAPSTSNPLKTIFYMYKRIKKVKQITSDKKIDLIISHSVIANSVALLAKKIYKLDIPLIITYHNSFMQMTSKMGSKGVISRKINLRLSPLADRTLSVSKGLSNEMIKLGIPQEKSVTIYNPINTDEIKELIDKSLPTEHIAFYNDGPVIIAAGRLSEQKNFSLLLKSFSKVVEEIDAKLVILGEGPQRKKLETLAKELCISENILMPGWVKNPFSYFHNSSVFVLSSKWEGFGNVIIEAMACKIPVISTNCNFGPNEIIEHKKNGLLVPLNDENKLAEEIINILSNPKTAKILTKETTKTIKKFDTKMISNQYNDLFAELLDN